MMDFCGNQRYGQFYLNILVVGVFDGITKDSYLHVYQSYIARLPL